MPVVDVDQHINQLLGCLLEDMVLILHLHKIIQQMLAVDQISKFM
jgi:hypothetical protein